MKMTQGGFAILEANFGKLKQSQKDEINFLVSEFDKDQSITYPQAAYMLATTWHETASTMKPIEEYGKGKNKVYGTWYLNGKNQKYSFKDYSKKIGYLFSDYPHLYYGRGYVQLTWFLNYEVASQKLGVDFVKNPELVMKKEYAVKILINGMKYGWFTGKGFNRTPLGRYDLNAYKEARRIINGTDKAEKIAKEAIIFEKALRSY